MRNLLKFRRSGVFVLVVLAACSPTFADNSHHDLPSLGNLKSYQQTDAELSAHEYRVIIKQNRLWLADTLNHQVRDLGLSGGLLDHSGPAVLFAVQGGSWQPTESDTTSLFFSGLADGDPTLQYRWRYEW